MSIHPLQSSGPISMGDINEELGRARTTPNTSLDLLENGSSAGYPPINQNSISKPSSTNPSTISEWRGYNHSTASSGGGGTVNTGYIYNNTGHTISAATLKVTANGTQITSVAVPSLLSGATYNFNTTYTSQIFSNGTFIIEFINPVIGISTANQVYMTGGSQSTIVSLSNTGSSFKATTISSGPQYTISITIK
jgi:hypothetical protein